MKNILITVGIIIGLLFLLILLAILLTPWMDRWGTKVDERTTTLPGDDLFDNPVRVANRAVTINAPVEKIYPWILQMGADKSGMYSYTWLERTFGCKMAKDETIHPEWHDLKVGDEMKMCAGDFAPPPYLVARLLPNQAVIFGHKEGDKWVETWQFVLVPQADGTTRLITRTSTNMAGGFWEIIRPMSFIMERKMLLTIKDISERP